VPSELSLDSLRELQRQIQEHDQQRDSDDSDDSGTSGNGGGGPGDARRRPPLLAVVAAAVLVAGVVAVGIWQLSGGSVSHAITGAVSRVTPSKPAAPPVKLTLSPADNASGVRLDAHAKVTASGGKLRSVAVTGAGQQLTGALSSDGRTWTSSGALQPSTRYQVLVTTVNHDGVASRHASAFTTLTPQGTLGASIMPLDGETVGVGMPIVIWFNQPVSDRAAVERHLKVETSNGDRGAWHWFNDREVHYRTQSYWQSGTQVTMHASLAGLDAGGGVWGVRDRTVHFTIGARHLSVVSTTAHSMTVTEGGKTVKVIPVSTGRDKYPTTNGIHFVLEKSQVVTMDSATVGIPRDSPDGYYEKVYWDVRIANSGEFVHAAPWSTSAQGNANVSHGCVNISVADAQWFYNFSRRGDVVQVTGSPKAPTNSLGVQDWNTSWSTWLQGSALPH
jgi:lipoprotein-anchoring transpeptidase ErfK/SrfK